MGILVALAVVQVLHQLGGRVADMQGHRSVRLLLNGLPGLHGGHLHGVGFARQGHVDHCFRQVHVAFGHPDEVARLIGRHPHLHGPGIRQAHVLRREAQHPPGDVQRILAALQHPHHPVDRRVRIRVPHGLMEGGNQVVMLLPVLVVHQALPAQALGQGLVRHGDAVLVRVPVEHHHLQGAQGAAGVPVAEVGDGPQGPVVHGDVFLSEPPVVRQRPPQQAQDVLPAQGLQHEHLAPGQQRAVDLKGRILRRRADQHDAPLLHEGQKRVLLGLVEAVNFIHEHDGPHAVHAVFLRLGHHLPDFLDAAGDGGKVDKGGPGLLGDDLRQGGFPHPRRPPEDHGGNGVRGDEPAEQLSLSDQVLLPGELLQASRPHPGRQGLAVKGGVPLGNQR